MKPSKPIYALSDLENFIGLVWETEKGIVVTINGELNPNNDIKIKDVTTGENIKDIDMRNVLMEVLGL